MHHKISFPLAVQPKLLNPGISNADRPHCIALTYFQGQLIIAYGSSNRVVIATNTLSIIASLDEHHPDSYVTALAWAPYSGRLSSASTDNRIIIWEPENSGWKFAMELNFSGSPLDCLSWSMCDHIFCTCSDQFTIYHQNPNIDPSDKKLSIKKVCFVNVPTIFCSHSRDSRFILTLPKNSNEVILYHKREKSSTEYCRIPLFHPSKVNSARWRTSDQIHERCCFMTIADDYIVRIWSETGVNEAVMFNVVASISSKYHTIAANFISTTSRLVSNSPMFQSVQVTRTDNYAYGHGHYPIRDRDTRDANVADQKELDRNHFWFLTFDRDQKMTIWEMSGISSNVRRTPTITQFSRPIKLGISSSAINQIFGFCRLESEYSHFEDPNFIGKPSSLSLIIQNRATKVLTAIDISLDKRLIVNQILNMHGHETVIDTIRVHQVSQLMVSLDRERNPILWKFDDTDVFDPTVLIHFICQLDIKLVAVDWLTPSNSLIGFDGKDMMVIDMPADPTPLEKPKLRIVKLDTNLSPNLTRIRVVCELSGGYVFYALASDELHILWLRGDQVYLLKHIRANSNFTKPNNDKNNNNNKKDEKNKKKDDTNDDDNCNNMRIIDCANAYITSLLPYAGATVCLYATKRDVFVTYMTTTGKVTQKNMASVISVEKCITLNDRIRGLSISHPGYLFIACDRVIHICWRVSASSHEFRILHSIPMESKPLKIRCIPTGLLSVVCKDGIYFYHPIRESNSYLQSNLVWRNVASFKASGIGALDWTLDGLLLYAAHNQIFAFTKFMDTFFLEASHEKLPTIHHTLACSSEMVSDFHPSSLIPIIVSGRIDLLLRMLQYLNNHYDDKIGRWFFTNFILSEKEESQKIQIEAGSTQTQELLKELAEKIQNNPIPEFAEEDNKMLEKVVENLHLVLEIPNESIDQRGMTVARAIKLDKDHMIPFDLINLAYMSQDQTKLLTLIDFTSWESIENSGVFFWINDLPSLITCLVPFAISSFEDHRHISIILLTIVRKFVVLKMLFKKAGDDTRAQFFMRDFSKERERKSAEKNGYSALSKQDYHIAAAMFFLAGRIDIAVRVIMQNINDVSLAFFICSCFDNEKSINDGLTTRTFIEEIIMPMAKKENDFSAIDFFGRLIDTSRSYSVDERYQNAEAGNMIRSANFFGDMRFCTCEILRTNLDQKANLMLCMLLSGHYLLASLYIDEFNVFNLKVFDENNKYDIPPNSTSTNFNPSINSTSFGNFAPFSNRSKSIEFRPLLRKTQNLQQQQQNKIAPIIAKQVVDNDSDSDSDESDDNHHHHHHHQHHHNNKKEEEKTPKKVQILENGNENDNKTNEDSEYEDHDNGVEEIDTFSFGYTGAGIADSLYSDYSTDEYDNSISEDPEKSLNSTNGASLMHPSPSMTMSDEYDKYVPEQSLPTPKQYNVGLRRMSTVPRALTLHTIQVHGNSSTSKQNREKREKRENSSSAFGFDAFRDNSLLLMSNDEEEDFNNNNNYNDINDIYNNNSNNNIDNNTNEIVVNWFVIVIVFNIARCRLESYLETQHDFSEMSLSISKVHSDIIESGEHVASMIDQLQDYLIRSCKRRCFVFRRLLLLSNDKAKHNYIMELCRHLAQLPDQMMAFRLSSQQATQIAQTVICLIRFINQRVISMDKFKHFPYVVASITTAIYIVAVFYHDVNLMKAVISLELDKLSDFPDEITSCLRITAIEPCEAPYNNPHTIMERNDFGFLSNTKAQTFTANCLPQFASALLDFMLIDTFYRNVSKLSEKCPKYLGNLLMFLRKLHDIYVQLFSYATLNFPVFLKLKSMNDIKSDSDNDLNGLIQFLIDKHDRRRIIPLFCKSLITRFAYRNIKSVKNVSNQMKLQKPKKLGGFKTVIRDICLSKEGSILFITTQNGLEKLKISKPSLSQNNSSNSSRRNSNINTNTNSKTNSNSNVEANTNNNTNNSNITESNSRTSLSKSTNFDSAKSDVKDKQRNNSLIPVNATSKVSSSIMPKTKMPTSSSGHSMNGSNEKLSAEFGKASTEQLVDNLHASTGQLNDHYNNDNKNDKNESSDDNNNENENDDNENYDNENENDDNDASLIISPEGADDDFSQRAIFTDKPGIEEEEGGKKQSHSAPVCIARHPIDNYALIGDLHGRVWLRSFSENSNECIHFETGTDKRCGGLSFADDGTMFAAIHGSDVELWSLCLKQGHNTKPFTVIKTFSKEVVGFEFVKGTGLMATAQIQSSRFKANIAFWDILMQNSMVASLKLKEKFGTVSCMAYTPRYSQIFVATTKGKVCTIDTRQFQIINSWTFDEKKHCGISAMAIDENQTYIATGSTNGYLKIWDIQSSVLLSEAKDVHKTKNFHVKGKLREFGITTIDVQNDVIYTGGVDGTVRMTIFAP